MTKDIQGVPEGHGEPREPAPLNNLPSWSECDLILANHEFRQRAAAGLKGVVLDLPEVTPTPTALHRFIHEYDDADPYRSDWFMHRLELVMKEVLDSSVQPKGTEGNVVVTWNEDRTRILAVTRQDDDGHILSVIAEVPAPNVQPKGTAEPAAWKWHNKVTGAQGCYFEDPAKFMSLEHPDYEWTKLYTHPAQAPRSSTWMAAH